MGRDEGDRGGRHPASNRPVHRDVLRRIICHGSGAWIQGAVASRCPACRLPVLMNEQTVPLHTVTFEAREW